MANIPRRKIYEELLEFEEKLMEIEILIQNEKNFEKFKDTYGKESFEKLKYSYERIKALFVMFLENKKYEKDEEFEGDLDYYIRNEQETNNYLQKDKNLKEGFKNLVSEMDKMFSNQKFIENLESGLKAVALLDEFDTIVPQLLQIRRDKMRK